MTTEGILFPEFAIKQRGLMPEGFRYQENIISEAEEVSLAKSLRKLDLKPFEFHGHLGNRRVASFGLRYDYARRTVNVTDGFPAFVADLQNKVAEFAGRKVDEFQQGGVNEYPPGAGIGWHKDKPQFGVIVGVSLLAPATMRFRRVDGTRRLRASQRLSHVRFISWKGERSGWEHSVPPVDALRYSLTFRTIAEGFRVDEKQLSLEKFG